MKKSISVLALLLVLSFQASAQSFGLGFKGGLNLSKLNGSDAGNNDLRAGYHAGLMLDMGVNRFLSIQPELLYSTKGYKLEVNPVSNVTTTYRARISYIDVPLLLKIKASNLFFEAGPQLSFLLNAREEVETVTRSGNNTFTNSQENTTTDNFNSTDFGVVIGLGYRADNGLGLGFRYNAGLKDVGDEGYWANREIRNVSYQLSLSYLLH